ncbi:MAG TPA: Fur family transcriptional regulator [Steroidobacteraceae bacterium]|nr:Fur family transcriptional regulator [Steroidobacteraceae bacterium]
MTSSLEEQCIAKGVKMTGQRRVILRVLSESTDHPDADTVFRRAAKIDPKISIATVYRTVHKLEEVNILESHDFGGDRLRYEQRPEQHHDHLIDVRTGKVIEFTNPQIEELQQRIAQELGFRLVGHRLELYAMPLKEADKPKAAGHPVHARATRRKRAR